ncbi:L,D-transpeptidase family protein [Streptomyces sp. NPDC005483]|uniref:L,D-transpeptidase family protein n=1 Tax=Streptomyces sp. NPDC005483 TaxID=3154882 RepID=UPI0033A5295C
MRLHRPYFAVTAALAVSVLGITAFHHTDEGDVHPAHVRAEGAESSASTTGASVPPSAAPSQTVRSRPQLPSQLPGLGPKTLAHIPPGTRQVLVVTGTAKNAASSQAVLWRRVDGGWLRGEVWAAHNGYRGWTDRHYEGDLHSPIGVFGLTDAGGRLADPGTKLPYHRSGAFSVTGTGFEGEPLDGSFDYVVALNYNRQPGTSPMDGTKPLGASRGGGIWIHVDHGGPTHACISLSKAHMRQLLRALDPADHPVAVLGDAASLAH